MFLIKYFVIVKHWLRDIKDSLQDQCNLATCFCGCFFDTLSRRPYMGGWKALKHLNLKMSGVLFSIWTAEAECLRSCKMVRCRLLSRMSICPRWAISLETKNYKRKFAYYCWRISSISFNKQSMCGFLSGTHSKYTSSIGLHSVWVQIQKPSFRHNDPIIQCSWAENSFYSKPKINRITFVAKLSLKPENNSASKLLNCYKFIKT